MKRILPFLGNFVKWYRYHLTVAKWYRYQGKVVLVPLTRTKVVSVPRQSGTGTNFQNMIGTGTTLLPATLIFGILTLLSSNSNTEGIGTLIND